MIVILLLLWAILVFFIWMDIRCNDLINKRLFLYDIVYNEKNYYLQNFLVYKELIKTHPLFILSYDELIGSYHEWQKCFWCNNTAKLIRRFGEPDIMIPLMQGKKFPENRRIQKFLH